MEMGRPHATCVIFSRRSAGGGPEWGVCVLSPHSSRGLDCVVAWGGRCAPLYRSHIRQIGNLHMHPKIHKRNITTDNEFASVVESFVSSLLADYGIDTSMFRGSELLCCLKYQVGMCVFPKKETDGRLRK